MSSYRYRNWTGTEGGKNPWTQGRVIQRHGFSPPEQGVSSLHTACWYCTLRGHEHLQALNKNTSQNRRLFSAAPNCLTATVLSILCLHSIYAERGQIRRHPYYYLDRMRVTFVCKTNIEHSIHNIARVGYCIRRQHSPTQRQPLSNSLRRISTVVLRQQGQDQPRVWIREAPHSPEGWRALRYRKLPLPCNIFVVIL